MNYFVISNDGQKYGPGDLNMLNQWAQEGRLVPTSMVEDAVTGLQMPVTQVPGIMFPPPPSPSGTYQPPYSSMGAYDNGSGDITKVWIFSAISLVPCCPILFGILAIISASNAQKKGHPQGNTAMIVAIVALVLGLGVFNVARHLPHWIR